MNAGQVQALVDQIMALIVKIIGWALVLMIAAKVAQVYGFRLPIPTIDHTALLYTAGALWLVRK